MRSGQNCLMLFEQLVMEVPDGAVAQPASANVATATRNHRTWFITLPSRCRDRLPRLLSGRVALTAFGRSGDRGVICFVRPLVSITSNVRYGDPPTTAMGRERR